MTYGFVVVVITNLSRNFQNVIFSRKVTIVSRQICGRRTGLPGCLEVMSLNTGKK